MGLAGYAQMVFQLFSPFSQVFHGAALAGFYYIHYDLYPCHTGSALAGF
jgi:hypothetical protein